MKNIMKKNFKLEMYFIEIRRRKCKLKICPVNDIFITVSKKYHIFIFYLKYTFC
jgi:hypothetical protein